MPKRLFLTILSLILPMALLFPQSGDDIMRRVKDRETGSSSHALVQMELTDKKGVTSRRTLEMYGVKDSQGLNSMVVVFHEPASVRNTRYLAVENKGRDDDKWIFLPALKRVRRIAASEGGSSFMGSDFTYDDMSDREVEKDAHRLLREEQETGIDCFVVESVPKTGERTQYSRRVSWVDRERFLPLKIELFDRAGKLVKVATLEEIRKIQGYWTPTRTTMRNVQTGTATVLAMDKFVWDEALPAGIFTQRFLETGRP